MTTSGNNRPASDTGGQPMESIMKKFVLAAAAALTLGLGVASAATVGDGSNVGHPSSAFTYSPVNG